MDVRCQLGRSLRLELLETWLLARRVQARTNPRHSIIRAKSWDRRLHPQLLRQRLRNKVCPRELQRTRLRRTRPALQIRQQGVSPALELIQRERDAILLARE